MWSWLHLLLERYCELSSRALQTSPGSSHFSVMPKPVWAGGGQDHSQEGTTEKDRAKGKTRRLNFNCSKVEAMGG